MAQSELQRMAPSGSASSMGQVFITVLTRGPLCRRDVAEVTGLSQGSVTKLAKPMIDAGYLVETEPVSSGPGRPMVPLAVVAAAKYAVGVKVMTHEVVAVLIDMSGAVRVSQRYPVDARKPDAVVARIAEAVTSYRGRSAERDRGSSESASGSAATSTAAPE